MTAKIIQFKKSDKCEVKAIDKEIKHDDCRHMTLACFRHMTSILKNTMPIFIDDGDSLNEVETIISEDVEINDVKIKSIVLVMDKK